MLFQAKCVASEREGESTRAQLVSVQASVIDASAQLEAAERAYKQRAELVEALTREAAAASQRVQQKGAPSTSADATGQATREEHLVTTQTLFVQCKKAPKRSWLANQDLIQHHRTCLSGQGIVKGTDLVSRSCIKPCSMLRLIGHAGALAECVMRLESQLQSTAERSQELQRRWICSQQQLLSLQATNQAEARRLYRLQARHAVATTRCTRLTSK